MGTCSSDLNMENTQFTCPFGVGCLSQHCISNSSCFKTVIKDAEQVIPEQVIPVNIPAPAIVEVADP